jgi:hypothetical protein
MPGPRPRRLWQAPPNRDAQRFVLSREELTQICWNFFLDLDRHWEYVFPEHQTEEQFNTALDDAVGFAVECAVVGLAP